jgi:hypothetical protein
VDKRRYDHALAVSQQFDAAGIRLVEVLNDRGYDDAEPKPQSIVWERMNLPIARGLRGLIYVLWDLSQVDPSDLATLFAGHGRLRIGFGEIDPSAGQDPSDGLVARAVQDCCGNRYCTFSKPAGTSLICIQGEWSNVVDARIKGGLAAVAMGGATESPYSPLFARATQAPRPWGVTALFAEHTGSHPPLDIEWAFEKSPVPTMAPEVVVTETVDAGTISEPVPASSAAAMEAPAIEAVEPQPEPAFSTLWEFAVAVNRSDRAALVMAGNGAKASIPVEGTEVRKLLGTIWFRGVVPRLSQEWQSRLLEALVDSFGVADHVVKIGRRAVHVSELSYGELQEIARTSVSESVRTDLDLLLTVGRLWGAEAIRRFRFTDRSPDEPSKLMSLLHGFRHP